MRSVLYQLDHTWDIPFKRAIAMSYRVQLVEGRHYLLKVLLTTPEDEQKYAHLRVWEKLNGITLLKGVEFNVTDATPLGDTNEPEPMPPARRHRIESVEV